MKMKEKPSSKKNSQKIGRFNFRKFSSIFYLNDQIERIHYFKWIKFL